MALKFLEILKSVYFSIFIDKNHVNLQLGYVPDQVKSL
jgi:hypothetical protein